MATFHNVSAQQGIRTSHFCFIISPVVDCPRESTSLDYCPAALGFSLKMAMSSGLCNILWFVIVNLYTLAAAAIFEVVGVCILILKGGFGNAVPIAWAALAIAAVWLHRNRMRIELRSRPSPLFQVHKSCFTRSQLGDTARICSSTRRRISYWTTPVLPCHVARLDSGWPLLFLVCILSPRLQLARNLYQKPKIWMSFVFAVCIGQPLLSLSLRGKRDEPY